MAESRRYLWASALAGAIASAAVPAAVLLVAMATVWTSHPATVASAQATTKVDFRRDVQPVLAQYCLECHGPSEQSGGFRVDQRRSVRKVTGRLQPGSSATSRLYLRLIGSDFGPQMPKSEPLRADQIALIKDWIDQGADWPDELAGDDPRPPPPDPMTTRMVDALRHDDHQSFAKILSAHPRLVNRTSVGGATALMYAALYGESRAVGLLLDRGADPNIANDAGATALMWAVDHEDITRVLLERGADPNAASQQGQTPLGIAAGRFGSSRVVKLLLDFGATPSRPAARPSDRSQPGSRPWEVLIQAANSGDEAVFRMLVKHGADLKSAGALPLLYAARAECAACVEMLIETVSQADLNYALVALAPYGDTSLLTKLIDRGADVNTRVPNVRRDMRGRTPLMLAAISDFAPAETVRMLIAKGADINAVGPEGETALDLAKRNGETPVVDALLTAGAKAGRGFRSSAVTAKPAASVQVALERIIPVLQRSDVTFIRKAGCVSCHNNTLTAMTIATARAHRVRVDEEVASTQLKTIASVLEGRKESALLGSEIQNTASTILVGLAAEHYAPDLSTDAMAYFLKARQLVDGRWRNFFVDHRPPLGASDIDVTAFSIRALRVYAPKPHRRTYQQAIERGTAWLMTAEPKTTYERALQLLGLAWGGVDARHERVRTAARALLAEQRSDGGWGQLPTLASDAYGTGQAMVALHEAGALRAADAAYQRGVRYLLNTQLEDGSWYVTSRSLPFQPYFESGFPHGPDQWISIAASNWASMALARAAPVRGPTP
jgi:ankyrin repeat protein